MSLGTATRCVVALMVFFVCLPATAAGPLEEAKAPATKVTKDIVYAAAEGTAAAETTLDVHAPAAGTGLPVLVWVHGGAWTTGDKDHVGHKASAFVVAGFVFVSINYRLIPDLEKRAGERQRLVPGVEDYAVQAGDVARAIAWVHRNAAQHGGDGNRIYLMGHSAGAHLVALVATDQRYLKAEGVALTVLKGAIPLDGGGLDIPRQITELGGEQNRRVYRAVFGPDPETWRNASPISHVDAGKGIPPFLIVPVADRDDTTAQAEAFAKALSAAGVRALVKPAPGKTHRTLNQELGAEGDGPTRDVLAFLGEIEAAAKAASPPRPDAP